MMPSTKRLIRLRRLKVMASIGVLAHELQDPQTIYFDIEMQLLAAALEPDAQSIQGVLDYRQVRQIIHDEVARGHVFLVEALVDRVAIQLLAMPLVANVRVGVFKPQAFDDCDEVGIEVYVEAVSAENSLNRDTIR